MDVTPMDPDLDIPIEWKGIYRFVHRMKYYPMLAKGTFAVGVIIHCSFAVTCVLTLCAYADTAVGASKFDLINGVIYFSIIFNFIMLFLVTVMMLIVIAPLTNIKSSEWYGLMTSIFALIALLLGLWFLPQLSSTSMLVFYVPVMFGAAVSFVIVSPALTIKHALSDRERHLLASLAALPILFFAAPTILTLFRQGSGVFADHHIGPLVLSLWPIFGISGFLAFLVCEMTWLRIKTLVRPMATSADRPSQFDLIQYPHPPQTVLAHDRLRK